MAHDSVIDRFAPYSLKGVYEYRSAPYMEYAKHNVKCLLCDQFICVVSNKDHDDLLEEHVQSFRHKLRYVQLEEGQKLYVTSERTRRMNVIAELVRRINRLKSPPSKNHMNDLALQYIYFPLEEDKNNSPEEEERRRWKALTEQLDLYEQPETEGNDGEELVEMDDNDDEEEDAAAPVDNDDDHVIVVK
jgi:hypothetical protein